METETVVEPSKTEKQVHCAPSVDGKFCINSDGTPVVEQQDSGVVEVELEELLEPAEPLPVETVEVPQTKSLFSCASCNSIGPVDSAIFSFALIVPLIIKTFKSL